MDRLAGRHAEGGLTTNAEVARAKTDLGGIGADTVPAGVVAFQSRQEMRRCGVRLSSRLTLDFQIPPIEKHQEFVETRAGGINCTWYELTP